jgi:hypothetical protein
MAASEHPESNDGTVSDVVIAALERDARRDGPLPTELEEAVRRRAFEISRSPHAGTPEENWHRAEVEVRAALGDDASAAHRHQLEAAETDESAALLFAKIGAYGHP